MITFLDINCLPISLFAYKYDQYMVHDIVIVYLSVWGRNSTILLYHVYGHFTQRYTMLYTIIDYGY